MVLTDYCMPEMTGYDLLKAIKVITRIKRIIFYGMCSLICMPDELMPQALTQTLTHCNLHGCLQALNPLKPIPVIVMSSEDEPQRISR